MDALGLILLSEGIHHSKQMGTAGVDVWGCQISLKLLTILAYSNGHGPIILLLAH